jgi:hypothetical protein
MLNPQPDLTPAVTEYTICPVPMGHELYSTLSIQLLAWFGGKWVVKRHTRYLSVDGTWEVRIGEDGEEWDTRCAMSFEDAVAASQRVWPTLGINGARFPDLYALEVASQP